MSKAHRQSGAEPDVIDNFRFDGHDLSRYHQIWLFGINGAGPDPLSASELRALSQFMDQGGGVFATGDHQNLGQAMAAEVPRVRSMRRWYWPGPGPNGEPPAPDQSGSGRHDTIVDTNPGVPGVQGSQSDETPQAIRVRWYQRPCPGPIFGVVKRYPHPVLCGPGGVINYLPDHMHEGLCEVPADLTQSFSFDGYTTTEYPTVGGHQEVPQVIAWATNTVSNTEFGVLAAYDGHRAGVGRVLVDATWHHWFNINLIGFLAASDPADPAYDPMVVPQWQEIKAHFRNVAAWLAPKGMQRCLRNGGWLLVVKNHDVAITFRRLEDTKNPLHYYWQMGTFARDALGRLATQCQHTAWVIDIFERLELPEFLRVDPWGPIPPRPQPDPPPFLDVDDLETVALGGAIDALYARFAQKQDVQELVNDGREIEAAVRSGAARAVAALVEQHGRGARSVAQLSEIVSK